MGATKYVKIFYSDGSENVFRVLVNIEDIKECYPQMVNLDIFSDANKATLREGIVFDVAHRRILDLSNYKYEFYSSHPGFSRRLDEFANRFI